MSQEAVVVAHALLKRALLTRSQEVQHGLLDHAHDLIEARYKARYDFVEWQKSSAAENTASRHTKVQWRRYLRSLDALIRELSESRSLLRQKNAKDFNWLYSFFDKVHTSGPKVAQSLKDLRRARRLGAKVSDEEFAKARYVEADRKRSAPTQAATLEPQKQPPTLRLV